MVVVVDEPESSRMLLLADESQSSRMLLLAGARPRPRRRRRRLRRRLADLVDVQFEISLVAGSEDEGEEQTGAQQAASLFNKMADPVSGNANGNVMCFSAMKRARRTACLFC